MATKKNDDKIFLWRENMETLDGDVFFNLVHIYLGEVKTPYNKQKLIESLEAIFRDAANQQVILSLLDEFDAAIISFVSLVPDVTTEKIVTFFSDEYTQAQIEGRVQNLHERLIIYTDTHSKTSGDAQNVLRLNPALEKLLHEKISFDALLMHQAELQKEDTEFFMASSAVKNLSPEKIASLISYVAAHPDLCKADGVLKKKDAEKVKEIFVGDLNLMQQLLNAIVNLQLVNFDDKKLIINPPRIAEFAKLPHIAQCAYICVASVCHLSRNLIYSQAQLLLDCISVVSDICRDGFTKNILYRMFFLMSEIPVGVEISSQRYTQRTSGRFAQMLLSASMATESSAANVTHALYEQMVDAAVLFGLLALKADRGAEKTQTEIAAASNKNVITISGLTVTIVPGLSLAELLELILFLDVEKYDTAVSFELSRASVFRAFDYGYDGEKICELLQKYSAFDVPQNIIATINDWEQSYRAAVLYKGYVLKLDEKNAQVFEKNPRVFGAGVEKIADGVYFLNVATDIEAAHFVRKCGFDFIGKMKTVTKAATAMSFLGLTTEKSRKSEFMKSQFANTAQKELNYYSYTDELKKLRKILSSLSLPKNKNDVLESRIARKIILSKAQMETTFVPAVLNEARGVDYSGKIHVLENAMQAHDKVTISLPSENNSQKFISYKGNPVFVNKKRGMAELVLQLDKDDKGNKTDEIKKFLVAQIAEIYWHKKL